MKKVRDKNPIIENYNWTLLHSAAFGGQLETYKYLVENLEIKDPKDKLGQTTYCCRLWACEYLQISFGYQQRKRANFNFRRYSAHDCCTT